MTPPFQYGQQQSRTPQIGRTLMGQHQQPQGQQYGQSAAHMPSQANAYGAHGTMPAQHAPAQPSPMTMHTQGGGAQPFADGGVVQPQAPSRLQALWQSLFGRNALQQAAGQGSQAPPPAPPPEGQDTSAVARAAQESARRMEAAKAAQGKPPMACGGVVE